MSDDGAFNDKARAAIYEAGGQRCIGCGDAQISAQHRRARQMGGTSGVAALSIGHPANGVPLCGDGVRGSHGWTEANPEWAALLGWRLNPGEHALQAPFWTRLGWRLWQEEPDGFVSVLYVDPDDLDQRDLREQAVSTYLRAAAARLAALHKRLGWSAPARG